jgi:hypothetical protein
MKIAFVTDSHFDRRNRFEECVRVHDWIYRDACQRGVALTLLGGDLFERRSVPEERNAAGAWLQQMATLGPVVGVRGNHDEDLSLLNELQSLHPITFYDRPTVVTPCDGLSIACLPWPDPARILAESQSREQADQTAIGCLRDILRGMYGESQPEIFLGHVQIRGSKVGTRQPLIGCSLELGLEDLALVGAKAYLLGHVHLAQQWNIDVNPVPYGGGLVRPWWSWEPSSWHIDVNPVLYGGSVYHCNYGEPERKYYTLLDKESSGCNLSLERVEIPATPMLFVESHWYPEHVGLPGDVVVPAGFTQDGVELISGSDVRFRYHVEAEYLEAARAAAEEWKRWALAEGAISVQLDPVVEANTRARAPEVAEARGLEAQLRAYWLSKGDEPDEPRAGRLLAKLGELEKVS